MGFCVAKTTPSPNALACFINDTIGRFVGGFAGCGGTNPYTSSNTNNARSCCVPEVVVTRASRRRAPRDGQRALTQGPVQKTASAIAGASLAVLNARTNAVAGSKKVARELTGTVLGVDLERDQTTTDVIVHDSAVVMQRLANMR
jgi:hypothetical protein